MICGTGIDIVEISRFERFVTEDNQLLLCRLFTPVEMAYCQERRRSAQHFALRFAAKEAFLKALGTGLREGLSWQHIEVRNDHNGKPEFMLSGTARDIFEQRGLNHAHLSLSHDGNYAVASVILEMR